MNVSVKWDRRPGAARDNLDLFVVEPSGGWHVSYDGDQTESLNVSVTAGSTYYILVMSYPLPQEFELRTALRVK